MSAVLIDLDRHRKVRDVYCLYRNAIPENKCDVHQQIAVLLKYKIGLAQNATM